MAVTCVLRFVMATLLIAPVQDIHSPTQNDDPDLNREESTRILKLVQDGWKQNDQQIESLRVRYVVEKSNTRDYIETQRKEFEHMKKMLMENPEGREFYGFVDQNGKALGPSAVTDGAMEERFSYLAIPLAMVRKKFIYARQGVRSFIERSVDGDPE